MPYGYLKVTFAEARGVLVNGAPNGQTNSSNLTSVGQRQRVTLEGSDYDPSYQMVDIYVDQESDITFTKKPAPSV